MFTTQLLRVYYPFEHIIPYKQPPVVKNQSLMHLIFVLEVPDVIKTVKDKYYK